MPCPYHMLFAQKLGSLPSSSTEARYCSISIRRGSSFTNTGHTMFRDTLLLRLRLYRVRVLWASRSLGDRLSSQPGEPSLNIGSICIRSLCRTLFAK